MTDYKTKTDEELVKMAQAQDNLAIETIIERYKNYVKAITRSYFILGADIEDVNQEGMIGLFKAVQSYSGKSEFKTYAFRCVKSRLFTAIKKGNSNKNKPLAYYISLSGDDENDIDKTEIAMTSVSDPETEYIENERFKELFSEVKKCLTEYEFGIMKDYLQGYSYKEIGKKYGKNEKSIDNALQRVRKKIIQNVKGRV